MAALRSQLEADRERIRRLETQLRNLADHDPLTDLLNRRSVEHVLEDHLAGCSRYGPEGALLLVGLDGLHEVACTAGPKEADELLAGLAEVVARRLAARDLAGRWKPDELAILLPRAAEQEVVAVAGAMIELVAEAATSRVPAGTMSASIGVAAVTAPLPDAAQLVGRAGGAMAVARGRGGGAWVIAGLEANA